jgi:hypothetical protein
VGFFDALLGRTSKASSDTAGVFAVTTAYPVFLDKMDVQPSQKAALAFRPIPSSYYDKAEEEIRDVLHISEKTANTKSSLRKDSFGYQWVLLEDEDFEDLVTAIHMVAETLTGHGFRDQILAAVFGFRKDGKEIHWVYNYKSSKFYPFVPQGNRMRDSAMENRMAGAMKQELPLEKDSEQWFGLWGIPH